MGISSARDRALGALAGVAVGDAMGMPTQTMTPEEIAAAYGPIAGFRDAAPGQPVSAGLKAGTITDDTEQSLLLARHLIARNGAVDQKAWANELLAWERDTHARGVNDLLGPSTKRAIEALQRGIPPTVAGRFGTTNGAAMRIVPVAIATPPEPVSALVDAVEESCRLTHNTGEAVSAASAVAAVVSAGIAGKSFEETLPLALAAAEEGERRGTPPAAGSVARAIRHALARAEGKKGAAEAHAIGGEIGTSVAAIESIPMAFAIVRLAGGNPWEAALLSAAIGDDTDTIGAISCGMAAACKGLAAIPAAAWQEVVRVNRLDVAPLAEGLLAIRQSRSGSAAQ